MSSRNARLYLQDILQACDDILDFTQGMKSASELQADRRTFLAVVHSLQIIGEATRQIPKSLKEKYPDFPWREAASLRNVIAHEYFGLDVDIIWDVIKSRIPTLAELVRQIEVE
jgi:uncharacterized protein with HEPN domain